MQYGLIELKGFPIDIEEGCSMHSILYYQSAPDTVALDGVTLISELCQLFKEIPSDKAITLDSFEEIMHDINPTIGIVFTRKQWIQDLAVDRTVPFWTIDFTGDEPFITVAP